MCAYPTDVRNPITPPHLKQSTCTILVSFRGRHNANYLPEAALRGQRMSNNGKRRVCVSLFGRRHGGAAHVTVDGGKPKTLQPTTTTRNTTRTAIRRTSVPFDRDEQDDDGKTTEKPQNVRPYQNAPIRTSVWGRGHGIVRVITRATISGTACLSTSPTPIVTRPRLIASIFARNSRGGTRDASAQFVPGNWYDRWPRMSDRPRSRFLRRVYLEPCLARRQQPVRPKHVFCSSVITGNDFSLHRVF